MRGGDGGRGCVAAAGPGRVGAGSLILGGGANFRRFAARGLRRAGRVGAGSVFLGGGAKIRRFAARGLRGRGAWAVCATEKYSVKRANMSCGSLSHAVQFMVLTGKVNYHILEDSPVNCFGTDFGGG